MADFKAKLKYLTKEEGGKRTTPTHSGYRPHVKFPCSENLTPGKQIFLDKAVVNPGDEVTAEITIVDHVTFRNALYVGMDFEFKEAANLIGTGIIIEVINQNLMKS